MLLTVTNPVLERSAQIDLASLPLYFTALVVACVVVATYLNRSL